MLINQILPTGAHVPSAFRKILNFANGTKKEFFTLNNSRNGAFNFSTEDDLIRCSSPYSVSTMSMLDRSVSNFDALDTFLLNKKKLHTAIVEFLFVDKLIIYGSSHLMYKIFLIIL